MPPDQRSKPKGGREEFEVAYYTKELGRTLQRQMLRQRLSDLAADSRSPDAKHGEEGLAQLSPPPPEDRAG